MYNVVEFSLDLRGIVEAAGDLSIIENAFMNFPIEDFLNHNCWLSMMPAPILDSNGIIVPSSESPMTLESVALALSAFKLNMTCIECSSPMLEDLSTLLSTDLAAAEMADFMKNMIDSTMDLLGTTFLPVQLNRMITQAPLQCPHSVSYDKNAVIAGFESFQYQEQASDPITFMYIVLAIVGATIAIVIVIYMVTKFVKRRHQKIYLSTLSEQELMTLRLQQKSYLEKQLLLNSETSAMFLSRSIPFVIRVTIPLVVLANIGFFLSGHLSLGEYFDKSDQS